MSKKFLYVNTNGDYEESSGAYEQSDFISSYTGSSGEPVKTDTDGYINNNLIDPSEIDHGSLLSSSLDDDDHTIYSLSDGTRDYTGVVAYDSHKTFTNDADIVDKKYVDDAIATAGTSAEWYDSVIDRYDPTSGLPGSPSSGDRYLATATANGWTVDYVYEWTGSAWAEQIPSTGTYVSVDDEIDGLYYYGGSSWSKKYYEATTASLGCEKVGLDIRADLFASGGIKLVGNELAVEPNDFAGEGLVDDGSDNLAISWSTAYNDSKAVKASDLNSTATGKGASIIKIEDPGALISATTVEGALIENRQAIDAIEDNDITSPNGTISVAGTIGADNQTVDISWSTTFDDSKAVKASDLSSTANGYGASIIGLEDAGGYTTATDVEAALQELFEKTEEIGITYTVGTGGVSKGDLVYISAADTASKFGDISQSYYAIGIAADTRSAAQQVKVLANDSICSGILVGATAGTRMFWNGSTWTNWASRSTTSGHHIWAGGVCKNATDMQVEVIFVKRNA